MSKETVLALLKFILKSYPDYFLKAPSKSDLIINPRKFQTILILSGQV